MPRTLEFSMVERRELTTFLAKDDDDDYIVLEILVKVLKTHVIVFLGKRDNSYFRRSSKIAQS